MHSESLDESDEELQPLLMDFSPGKAFVYNDPLSVTGILRAVVEGDFKKIEELVSSGHSLNIKDGNGNTPLHVSVIKNNLKILRYLVTEDATSIDSRNIIGQTPLFIAVKWGYLECGKILIESGANINLPKTEEVTPLHISVKYSEFAHLLIKSGADVNAKDYGGDTPLHYAVAENNLETVCMLLYYKADANALGKYNLSCFIKAVVNKNCEIQEVLLEYVDNYADDLNLISLAIKYESPLVEEIIKRAGKVNIAAVKASIDYKNINMFKLVWNQPKEDPGEFCVLLSIYHAIKKICISSYLDVVLRSDDSSYFKNILENIDSYDSYRLFLYYFFYFWDVFVNISSDKITQLACLLLQYGLEFKLEYVLMIFKNMGYCNLFKILIYIDYDYDWSKKYDITTRLIMDIFTDMENICNKFKADAVIIKDYILKDIETSLKYWIYPSLIDLAVNKYYKYYDSQGNFVDDEIITTRKNQIVKRFSNVPRVPSLLQLARDQTRKYIVNKLSMKTSSQYYTYINHIPISIIHKNILTFETPIYNFLLK